MMRFHYIAFASVAAMALLSACSEAKNTASTDTVDSLVTDSTRRQVVFEGDSLTVGDLSLNEVQGPVTRIITTDGTATDTVTFDARGYCTGQILEVPARMFENAPTWADFAKKGETTYTDAQHSMSVTRDDRGRMLRFCIGDDPATDMCLYSYIWDGDRLLAYEVSGMIGVFATSECGEYTYDESTGVPTQLLLTVAYNDDPEERLITYTDYKFDSRRNWIERKEIADGDTLTVKRRIDYR